jgi:hypothetical protein
MAKQIMQAMPQSMAEPKSQWHIISNTIAKVRVNGIDNGIVDKYIGMANGNAINMENNNCIATDILNRIVRSQT